MKSPEYEKFSLAMDKLLKVSHEELRARLDAEKSAKAKTRRRKSKSSKREK